MVLLLFFKFWTQHTQLLHSSIPYSQTHLHTHTPKDVLSSSYMKVLIFKGILVLYR